jgi:complex III assembly factor LYRM7
MFLDTFFCPQSRGATLNSFVLKLLLSFHSLHTRFACGERERDETEMSSLKEAGREAKQLFRQLLRARQRLFSGDKKALDASAIEIRSHFDANRNVTDEEEIKKRIRDGREAQMFLTTNVLQGKMNERGNFETQLKSADPDKETWEVPKEAK